MNQEHTPSADGALGIPGWGSVEFGRRLGLKALGATALAGGVASLAKAAAAGATSTSTTIKIGYVTPKTGSLADFAGPDSYVISLVKGSSYFAKGMKIGGKTYKFEITVKDSQSNPSVASQVTTELIQSTGVDIVVTSSAPETTIPVSAVCEQAGIPCVSTVCPWEGWWTGVNPSNSIGATGNAVGTPPKYCTMFFFGIPEFVGTFMPMWLRIQKQLNSSNVYAAMFPNDADGNAFAAAWPPTLNAISGAEGHGQWVEVFGGAYTDGTTDYTSMIETFKAGSNGKPCDFFVNCPLPPDFNTFWKQANQQGFKPQLATVAKVMLFPTDVYALGSLSNNIATDAWWTPYPKYSSSLTGESASKLASDFEHSTGNEWVDSLGSSYSLFEVAIEAFKGSDDPHDHAQVAHSLQHVNYSGMCGPLNFGAGPAPGVGIIKPVGVQWKPGKKLFGKKFPWQEFVVDNSLNKDVPINGDLVPTNRT